jgi:hypothetical protein
MLNFRAFWRRLAQERETARTYMKHFDPHQTRVWHQAEPFADIVHRSSAEAAEAARVFSLEIQLASVDRVDRAEA